MESVILVIHLILALAIIGLVLLQRSEGGGLVNTSGGLGSFASAHGTANALSRMTAICVAGFFATSLILGVLAGTHHKQGSVLDKLDQPLSAATAPLVPEAQKEKTKAKEEKQKPAPQEAPAAPVSE